MEWFQNDPFSKKRKVFYVFCYLFFATCLYGTYENPFFVEKNKKKNWIEKKS